MKGTKVTYKVKADKVEENESYIKKVFDKLRKLNDKGIKYGSFKLDDGQTFVHIAFFESDEKQDMFTGTEEFKAFQTTLKDRIEAPPNAESLTKVENWGLVDGN
jgi:quinol monooxygenase YgiN